ncbi:MAG TPA: hypothetical protein VF202_13620 [Trueperaceae bacterium]
MEVGRFEAWPAVKEAWRRLAGARRAFVYMSLTAAAVGWLVDTALDGVLPPARVELVTPESGVEVPVRGDRPRLTAEPFAIVVGPSADTARPWLEQVAFAASNALFAGAFAAYGLRRAVGQGVRYTMLAEHVRFFPTFLVYGLAVLVASEAVGEGLGGLVAAAAGVALAFARFFVVDRDAGPLDALRGSLALIGRNLGQALLLQVSGGAAVLLALVPLILARVWGPPALVWSVAALTYPVVLLVRALFTIAEACAFREAVGVHTAGGPLPVEGVPDRGGLSSGA